MIEPIGILHAIAGFQRELVDWLEDTFGEAAADAEFRSVYEAELRLPPGALAGVKPPARPAVLDGYADDETARFEVFMNGVDDMVKYIDAWRAVLEAAEGGEGGRVIDEMVHRLFELAILNQLKHRRPRLYWWMQLVGVIAVETRVHAFETLRYDRIVDSICDAGRYYRDLYLELRTGAAVDPEPLTDDEAIMLAWSDYVAILVFCGLFGEQDQHAIYSWEPSPGSTTPLADAVADRTLTIAVDIKPPGDPEPEEGEVKTSGRVAGTGMLFADEGRPAGYLIALRGDVTFEHTIDAEQPPPWKLKTRLFAPDGAEVLLRPDSVEAFEEATLALEVTLKREPTATPAAVVPENSTGSRLEFGTLAFGLELNAEKAGIKARAENSALVLVPPSGFMSTVLSSRDLRLNFDFGLALDTARGLHLEGGAAFTATLPIARSFGPVTVQTVHLGIGAGDGTMDLRVLTSLSVKFSVVTFSLDRIGFSLGLGFGERGAGVPEDAITLVPSVYLDGAPGFEPPNGVGIAIEDGPVTGGGFLFHDPETGEFAGALEIAFRSWTLKAFGLLAPAPRGSKIGFSLLIMVIAEDFPPIKGPFGIKLTAVGGMVGLNHGSDVDALRSGLRNRALDAVLFPADVVANAPRIAANLRALFPPVPNQYLVGLMAKFEWPTPTLFTGDLGLVVEGPNPWRALVLGQFRARIPFADDPPVKVNIDFLGVLDGDGFSADATLYDSTVNGFAMTGDGALRIGAGGDGAFLFSVGGFHPRYTPPPAFPALRRLAIHFSEGQNLRMRAEAYLAVSSNAFQFGARVELYAGFAGFSVEGDLGFDALFQNTPPELVVQIEGGVAFKWHGVTLFGVWLSMSLTGFRPWHLEGKVTFEVWGFSKSKSFDKTFGEDAPPPAVPQIDPLPELVAALRDPRNWQADLPREADMLVALRPAVARERVSVHPHGRIAVRQRVVPLDVTLDHIGGARLRGDRRFSLGRLSVGGRPEIEPKPVTGLFAPAQYLELSDDQKLSRPSFEPMPSGLDLGTAGLRFGTDAQAVVADLDYETCIMDDSGRCVARPKERHRLPGAFVGRLAARGPASRAPLRRAGAARYRGPARDLRVVPTAYAVTTSAELTATASFASYTAAAQTLAPGQQVVAAFETKAPA